MLGAILISYGNEMEKSNSKQASVRLESIHGQTLNCHEVTGQHFGFNSRYCIQVKGRSSDVLNLSDYHKSVIYLETSNLEKQTLAGDLLSLEQCVYEQENFEFCLQIGSPLFQLDNEVSEKTYADIPLKELLTHLLGKYNISFEIHIQETAPVISYITQNGISDYDFLTHICAERGIVFYHQFSQDNISIIFTDNIAYQDMGELNFNTESGMNHQHPYISSLAKWDTDIAENIHLATMSDGGEAESILSQTINTTGTKGRGQLDLRHITPMTSNNDMSKNAQLLQQQIDWQRNWLYVEISGLLLWPTHFIQIKNHKTVHLNESMQVLDTSFRLNLLGTDKNNGLRVQTYLVPVSRPYRMPISSTIMQWPESIRLPPPQCLRQETEKPTIGLTRSEIFGENKSPQLDQLGQYMICSFYETSQKPVSAKLLQIGCIYSKKDAAGIHFPLPPQTRVITTQYSHNKNHPVILGVIPDIEQPSVVTQKNQAQSVIKFQSGTSLIFEESNKFLKLALCIKSESHGLIFKSHDLDSLIEVRSHQDVLLQSKVGLYARSTGALNMQSKQMILGAQKHACFLSMKSIRVCTKVLNVKASNNWICISQKKSLNIKALDKLFSVSKGLIFKGHGFYVSSNKAQIQAKTNSTLKGEKGVAFVVNNASLKLEESRISLKGTSINFLSSVIIKNQGVNVEVS